MKKPGKNTALVLRKNYWKKVFKAMDNVELEEAMIAFDNLPAVIYQEYPELRSISIQVAQEKSKRG